MITQTKGQVAEQQALAYLIQQGLRLITQNYSCRAGEVDLIMNDGDQLVFVEVRARVSSCFGGGLESITWSKKQKIIKTARYYLLQHPARARCAIRFDAVCIEGALASLTWIKDAFGVDY